MFCILFHIYVYFLYLFFSIFYFGIPESPINRSISGLHFYPVKKYNVSWCILAFPFYSEWHCFFSIYLHFSFFSFRLLWFPHERKYFIFLIFGLVLLVFLCYISVSKRFAPCIIVSWAAKHFPKCTVFFFPCFFHHNESKWGLRMLWGIRAFRWKSGQLFPHSGLFRKLVKKEGNGLVW